MEEKCFFEINLVCGERDPVPAEEFEHAQWGSGSRSYGRTESIGETWWRPQDVTSPTKDPSAPSGSSSTERRKSSFKSRQSSSLG